MLTYGIPPEFRGGVHLCMYCHTYSKSMDQPGKVANPARGQLNRENIFFPCPRSRLRVWSRETGSAVPSRVSLLISILRLNLVVNYRNHAGQSTGVRSFSKSCRTCFFFAPRCDNADGCDNADNGAETQLNHFILSFSAPPVR